MENLTIEYIQTIYNEYHRINKLSLHEINFFENDEKLDIDPQVIESALNMALNPMLFITGGYYKNDWRKLVAE